MVEQVVHLENSIDAPVAAKSEAPLKPRIHTVDRHADEVVAWHDAAVSAQAGPIAAAIGRREPLARAVEIQTAQLESVARVPDPVEHRAMALVRRRPPVLGSEILHERESRGR